MHPNKAFVYLQDMPLKLGYSCSPKKNWGLYLGIVGRVCIVVAFLWTFIELDNPYIRQKGLLLRNPILLILSLVIPYLAWRRRVPPSRYPFRTDALLMIPIAVDMVANMTAGFTSTQYFYWQGGDKIAHFVGAGVVAYLAFLLLASRTHHFHKQFGYKLVILLSLALAGIWELCEYLSDAFLGTEVSVGGWLLSGHQLNIWQDILADLGIGLLGILLCVRLCQRWYKISPQIEKERHLETLWCMFSLVKS